MTKRHLFLAGLLLLLSGMSQADSEPHEIALVLVLVSGADLGDIQLTPNQLRRTFLGIPVSINGKGIRALRNTSDPLLNEIFLQKVVYMSEQRYNRQLVSRTFRAGRMWPPNFERQDDLIQTLKSIPGSISVMWEKDAKKDPALHIIQVLWKGLPR